MAKASDKKRWDDLHAAYAKADAAAFQYELELGRKYGQNFSSSWLSSAQRDKLDRLRAKKDQIGDKIIELLVRVSPRGDRWLSGVPSWWIREKLTWEDAIRPASEPLSVVVPGSWGSQDGTMRESRRTSMRFPTIADVSAELRRINKQDSADDGEDGGIDVRLQVHPDGNWNVNWGSSDYDQDHRGYWGSSSVPGDNRRFDSKDIARDLIDQAREHKATGGEGDDEMLEAPARVVGSKQLSGKAKEFKEMLDKGVILIGGDAEGSIDIDDGDPVFVSIVVNVTGYGPHVGAIYAQQNRFHGHEDAALEAAYEILEEWEMDHNQDYFDELEKEHGDEASSVFTETFDGRSWKLSAEDFAAAIKGTPAEKYIDIEASDPLGDSDEDEELDEEEDE